MLLRSVILAAARSARLEQAVASAPLSRDLVSRFVAGTTTADALRVTRELVAQGLTVTLDHLGEDTRTRDQATAARDEYLRLLSKLSEADLTSAAVPQQIRLRSPFRLPRGMSEAEALRRIKRLAVKNRVFRS